MGRIGLAFDRRLDDPGAFGGGIAALRALWRRAVNLDQLRIVNVRAERALDRFQICLVTIAR